MKTTIQSPATSAGNGVRTESPVLSKSQKEVVSIVLGAIGIVFCLRAEEGPLLNLILGAALVWVAAIISVKNNMRKKGGSK